MFLWKKIILLLKNITKKKHQKVEKISEEREKQK